MIISSICIYTLLFFYENITTSHINANKYSMNDIYGEIHVSQFGYGNISCDFNIDNLMDKNINEIIGKTYADLKFEDSIYGQIKTINIFTNKSHIFFKFYNMKDMTFPSKLKSISKIEKKLVTPVTILWDLFMGFNITICFLFFLTIIVYIMNKIFPM